MKTLERIRRARRAPVVGEAVGFSMTPMIDIVFQLIIFFMLITDMGQIQLELLETPVARKAPADPPEARRDRLIVNIRENGEFAFFGKPYRDAQALRGLIADTVARRAPRGPGRLSEVSMLIRADARAPFEHVQKVLQICGDARVGIYKVEIGARENAGE